MGIEALTRTDGGRPADPTLEGWDGWVSASATRWHVLDDPLLDWLGRYGELRGLVPDNARPGYDLRTDMTQFLFSQGSRFEAQVVALLGRRLELASVPRVASEYEHIRDPASALETFEAMRSGVPLIHQAVLWDAEHRTYGAPDLLVRSDLLARMFPDCIEESDAAVNAPDLGAGAWHYRVIDVKFTTLHLRVGGGLGSGGSSAAYQSQLHVYNRALGRLQGYEPPLAYLLGRSWEQTVKGETFRGTGCLERLAPVRQDGELSGHRSIADCTDSAVEWVRRVRREGAAWELLPRPSVPELYPNMSNAQDGPWHSVKRELADELGEISLLWQVGPTGRALGHDAGVYSWHDERCTPELLRVAGSNQPAKLAALLAVNRSTSGALVQPPRVHAAEAEWRPEPRLEFYVDFETVNDLADDFSTLPERAGQPLIFMIGCGHLEAGEWQFASFVADALDEPSEARLIEDWLAHMVAVRGRLDPTGEEPRLIHWSKAEPVNLETSYKSAAARHQRSWPPLRWFDFLGNVVREEPVVIRGALAFGLKPVARALHSHGLIETLWEDGSVDGLGAIVGAWWCQAEASGLGVSLVEVDLMQEIVRYNEVDCRVMMEIVRYLRANH